MSLNGHVVRLAKGVNLATVVTLMPDGGPQAQYTWIDTDGEYLLVNTVPDQQRYKNVQRDPADHRTDPRRPPMGLRRGSRPRRRHRRRPGGPRPHRLPRKKIPRRGQLPEPDRP